MAEVLKGLPITQVLNIRSSTWCTNLNLTCNKYLLIFMRKHLSSTSTHQLLRSTDRTLYIIMCPSS